MLTPEINKTIQEWTQSPYDAATIAEIKALQNAGNEKELFDRFYTDLEFGTGGLRGLLGAGRNRMNRYTVARATQGLANYLKKNVTGDLSVAIAFDSRNFSTEFAQEAACVLAASGVKAYLFDALRPTPELS
ncbi:TPA: phosphoglucomutase, partial [Candidatus Sumerlaeota bacterium]|nr:phosphoglucomutase [Candidatus Sumerlaeota bacterium]